MTNKCCQAIKKDPPAGFLPGVLYGLLPHTFCIAFVVFSVLGVTMATTFFRKILLVPYFFQILVLLSFIFATFSAAIYLKSNNNLSWAGIKINGIYLAILYGTTIIINLLLFMVVFPLAANLKTNTNQLAMVQNNTFATLKVAIPCSGHAPLITGELQKVEGVGDVKFRFPNYFDVQFDKSRVSLDEILGIEVFKTFQAEISN